MKQLLDPRDVTSTHLGVHTYVTILNTCTSGPPIRSIFLPFLAPPHHLLTINCSACLFGGIWEQNHEFAARHLGHIPARDHLQLVYSTRLARTRFLRTSPSDRGGLVLLRVR